MPRMPSLHPSSISTPYSNIRTGLLLLVLLLSLFSLGYSGTFLTDDEHILVSRTLSAAFDPQISDSRVFGNTRIFALSNLTPEEAAAQALNIEPLQELAGLPLARLADLLQLGLVQTIFLLNIGVVAATAVVVYGAVLLNGSSQKTALVVALLFGLGTQVWAYTRTYFRDPLAMLFLALAWVFERLLIRNIRQQRSAFSSWFAGIAMCLALLAGILSKNTVTFAFPILVADIFLSLRDPSAPRHRLMDWVKRTWKGILALALPLLTLLVLWLVFSPRIPALARYTPAYYLFILRFFFGTPHPHFLQALSGPFISPGKSIFLYSPVLVLSLVALIRRSRGAWPAWGYLGLLVLGQALFYDADWWGHRSWGLRFILPAIPPLMIASAPIIEKWLQSARQRLDLFLLGGASLLIQVISLLPLLVNYYVDIAFASPSISDWATVWNAKYSPILWSMNWILHGKSFDLAAVRVGISSLPLVIGFVLLAVLSVVGIQKIRSGFFAPLLLGITICLALLMPLAYTGDPAYHGGREDLRAASETVASQYQPGDLVLVKAYATPVWYYWMNWGDAQVPWTSLPFYFPRPDLLSEPSLSQDPGLAMDELTLSLLKSLPGTWQRVWLVLPSDTPGADLELESSWLKQISSSTQAWTFPGEELETRLLLFVLSED